MRVLLGVCMTHKSHISTFMNELWNVKSDDLDNLHQLFNPNLVAYSSLGRRVGADSLKDVNIAWGKAFPDMELVKIDIKVFGSMVVAEWRSKATHQQDFNGLMPTGKQVDYRGVTSFQFDQDKVVYYQCTIDLEHIYDQLGAHLAQDEYPDQHILQNDLLLLQNKVQEALPSSVPLSQRELICLSLFVHGWSAKQIARELGNSHRTVQGQVARGMEKLNCHSRHDAHELLQNQELLAILSDYNRLCIQTLRSNSTETA